MPPKLKLTRGLRDRIKLTQILEEELGSVAARIAALRARELSADLLDGESMPDGELASELELRALRRRVESANEAEQDYQLAAIVHKRLSLKIGAETADLSRQLGGLRQVVDLALGKGASARYLAFRGRTPRRQDAVYARARDVLNRLGAFTPSEPVLRGVSADPADWRAMIEPGFRQVEDLRLQLSRQEKLLDRLLIDKQRAFATFDDTARGLLKIAEGQCLLVGEKARAKRIRRLGRKRLRPGPKPKKKAKKKKKKKKASAKKAKPGRPETEPPEPPEPPRNPATRKVA